MTHIVNLAKDCRHRKLVKKRRARKQQFKSEKTLNFFYINTKVSTLEILKMFSVYFVRLQF